MFEKQKLPRQSLLAFLEVSISNVFRTAFIILSGNAMGSVLLLVRNLVVARMLPIEDYGIAATFGIVMTMVEMSSSFGLQQQIVQSKNGDDLNFQAALQGFQVLRGFVAGVVLFWIANPIASFLGIPEIAWAYQLLALVPIIKAFEHFDIYRLNRQMKFWPMILTGSIPAFLSLLATWPFVVWLGDWRVMLCVILAQISLTVLTSHMCSTRPYRLIFDRAVIAGSLKFGWPILATSIFLFFAFQGDKIIVGRVLGMEALAIFAMGITLTQTPILVLEKSAQNFFLPQLSETSQHSLERQSNFQYIAKVACEVHILLGAAFVFFIAVFDELIVSVVLGLKFVELVPIFSALAVLHSLRALKGGPSVVALAKGQNENTLAANTIRVLFLPIGYLVAVNTERLDYIAAIAISGEILGLIVALVLMSWRSKVNVKTLFAPVFISLLLFTVAIVSSYTSSAWMLWLIMFILLCVMVFYMKDFRCYIKNKGILNV